MLLAVAIWRKGTHYSFVSSLQLLNVQVPFFFKYAVDYFNKLPSLATPEGTIITMGTALLLGCEQLMYGHSIANLSHLPSSLEPGDEATSPPVLIEASCIC